MSLLQMGDVVKGFNTHIVTFVLRPAGDYAEDGSWTSSGAETLYPNVGVNIQPASGDFLKSLPEGESSEDYREIFTDFINIDINVEDTNRPPLFMVYRGQLWRLSSMPEDWRENGFINAVFRNTKKGYQG